MAGLEALVRWARPGLGIIEPKSFIPVAEDCGLIVPLAGGCWRARWAMPGAGGTTGLEVVTTVNLSAQELADPVLVERVAAALDRHQVAPDALCLEVTESDLVADADASVRTLLRLKDLRVLVAIDDFGTGYATLDYVRRFSMADILKIDQSFVENIDVAGSKDRAIVSAVIVLGQALGFRVVAEGVETASQLAVLRELGCDAAQGWWFGRPVPAGQVQASVQAIRALPHVSVGDQARPAAPAEPTRADR